MTRLADIAARILETCAALITVGVFAVMIAQVWSRYVLSTSIFWSEEIVLFGLVWIVFLGSAAVMRRGGHVEVPIVVDALPTRIGVPARLAGKFVAIVTLVALTAIGADVFGQDFHRTLPMTGLSSRWAKLAIPIGTGGMAFFAAVSLLDDLRRFRRDWRLDASSRGE